jgi:hypothetical protein
MTKEQLRHDCLTLAIRLMGEDPATFAPETAEVMDRWRPICKEVFAVGHDFNYDIVQDTNEMLSLIAGGPS